MVDRTKRRSCVLLGFHFLWPLEYLQACNALAPAEIICLNLTGCMCASDSISLDHESLDLVLQAPDLVHKITRFVRGDARCNNGSANTTSPAKCCLARNVHIRDVL